MKRLVENSSESISNNRAAEAWQKTAVTDSGAKSRFLLNILNEILTAANTIMGISELLLSEDLDRRRIDYAARIKSSAASMLNIINNTQDILKLREGEFTLLPVHYNFEHFISNINSIIHFQIKNKNITFLPEIKGTIPVCLYGDDIRLRQILLNLLNNAVKSTDKGSVSLIVDCTGECLRFTVSDMGGGIPEEDIPFVFNEFERADILRNRGEKVTGMELPIAKALVVLMGGTVSAESEYGRGTAFHVTVPKIPGDVNAVNNNANTGRFIIAPQARTLVVDDNAVNASVMRGLLRLHKIMVKTAGSGTEAVEMLMHGEYDLVFMDHLMPEMDGIETTRRIRAMGITGPIIALTANAAAGVKEALLASGMNGFLSKLVIKDELNHILSQWLPSEKIAFAQTAAEDTGRETAAVNENCMGKLEQIPELSVTAGLDTVAGRKDVYIETLRLMTKEIDNCIENLACFMDRGDLRRFMIVVHSIKGALANVGAAGISLKAKELETAAAGGDAVFCAANTPLFLEELESFGEKLKGALACIPAENPPEVLPAGTKEVFARLSAAFVAEDFLAIDSCVESLESLNAGVLTGTIGRLKDAVMMMDYTAAETVMKELSGGAGPD